MTMNKKVGRVAIQNLCLKSVSSQINLIDVCDTITTFSKTECITIKACQIDLTCPTATATTSTQVEDVDGNGMTEISSIMKLRLDSIPGELYLDKTVSKICYYFVTNTATSNMWILLVVV